MEKSEIVISESLFVIKAFAILSVTAAHCVYTDMYVQRLTSLIGTIGVPVFLIVAGYYFNKKEQWNVLAKKKMRRIVVPWIFMGGYILNICHCWRRTFFYRNDSLDFGFWNMALLCSGHSFLFCNISSCTYKVISVAKHSCDFY